MQKCQDCGAELENPDAHHCSECGKPVAASPPECDEAALPPVTLEFNDSRLYIEGLGGTLELRLTNTCDGPADGAIRIEGKRLEEAIECPFALAPHEIRIFALDISFVKAGEPPVQIMMHYTCNHVPRAFTSHSIFKVFAREDSMKSVAFHFEQNIKGGGGGDKIGFGMSLENRVNLADAIAAGRFKTVNELIEYCRQLPPQWRQITLCHDERATAKLRKCVRPFHELGLPQPLDKACIAFGPQNSTVRALLLGSPKICMGRLRSNDITLRLLPRGDANDSLSTRISRQAHVTLSVTREGIIITDNGNINGTYLNDVRIRSSAKAPIDHPSEVDVGRALKLRLIPFKETGKGGSDRYADLGRQDDLWELSERIGLRSLVIERVDNLADAEKYALVFRWIAVGRDPDCELVVPEADFDARIIRRGGGFWFETVNLGLTVNDIQVPQGCAVPLAPGLKLAAGTVCGEMLQFKQCGL